MKQGCLRLLVSVGLLLPGTGMSAPHASSCAMPLPDSAYWISSRYGMRVHPLAGVLRMHYGVDLACPKGTPVHAAAAGVVAFAGRWGCYGKVVMIQHPGHVTTLYAHLSRFAAGLRPGMPVHGGQVVAFSGASGCVTGAHLHFEVWDAGQRVNPLLVCVSGHAPGVN